MKYFNPRERTEPEGFRKWKRQELQTLMSLCKNSSKPGDAIYGHLPSSPPKFPEEGIAYYSKEKLRESLLKEQGYLCCFCNRIIEKKTRAEYTEAELADLPEEIEHMLPRNSHPKLGLYYDNLAISCRGGRGTGSETCNASKGKKPLKLTPFDKTCEERIYFTEDGQILGEDEDANDTISILNLTHYDDDRGQTIAGFIYELALDSDEEPDEQKLIDRDEALKIVAALSQKDSNGKFYPFCSAVISVIKREILIGSGP